MPEPKIYTRNYIDDECTLSFSHGSTFGSRLYDRDKGSQYVTEDADDDTEEMSIEVDFKEDGVAQEREIDTVILLNHNLRNPELEYWDGSNWQPLDSESNVTSSTTVFSFTAVETTKIRLNCLDTQDPDEEKAIGEIIACAVQLEFSQDLESYEVQFRQMASEVTLIDGSIHRTVVKHSLNRSNKYEARGRFIYLTAAEVDSLTSIKDSGEPFLWHPETTARPAEIYYVHWTGPLRYRYVSDYKSAGYALDWEFKEV